MLYRPVERGKLKHHCGIAAIYSKRSSNIPEKLFYALYSLQHRGQESAGIAYRRHGRITSYKDLGMVYNVLSHYLQEEHPSHLGIGHVRYSTHGSNKIENAQPIVVSCNKGNIALAHNGNLSNSAKLQERLFAEGSIFQTTTDTELILHLLAKSRRKDFNDALVDVLEQLEGAYSLVMIHDDTLIAVRDPRGFRPLVMGRKNTGKEDEITLFASETCALDMFKPEEVREVEPGEILAVGENGITSLKFGSPHFGIHTTPSLPSLPSLETRLPTEGNNNKALQTKPRKSQCIFELIYFARPDSTIFGYTVHSIRKRMGACLFERDENPGDTVISVPDSGNSAAQGYANASGIPFEQGLTRNHYTGRSFIQPTKSMREFGVRMKLHPVRDVIEGKRLTVVDDSLVRGTTSKTLVKLLKDAGAREVHLRLSSPEIKHPCFFGIDIPTKEELISNRLSPEEIAREIGADSVMFLSIEDLKRCVRNPEDFCYACFNGDYPTGTRGSSKESPERAFDSDPEESQAKSPEDSAESIIEKSPGTGT